MVKPVIVKRNTKGSALTFTEMDQNFQNLDDATISIAVSGGDTVVNDLNDTTTLVAVDGVSIVAVPSSQSIEFDASLVNDLTPQLAGDLDAQNQDITDVSGIAFNTATEQDHALGRIYWDPVDGTLAVGMEYDEVVGKVGMNMFYHVKNQTGSTIPKGTFVMAVGTIGASGQILCAPAVTDGTLDPRYMLGITNMQITNGGDGYAVHFGLIKGIDTQGPDSASDWSDGTVLWADPNIPGALTDTEPTAPNLKLAVAYVINAAANGSMFVRATTGSKLQDLHDVDVTGATDGQALVYDSSTGVWQPQTISIDINAGTGISIDQPSTGGVEINLANTAVTPNTYTLATITVDQQGRITAASSGTALQNVVEDLTPQLGGNLDVNGYSIISASNGNIVIDPDGTGNCQITADNVILGDGSGTVTLNTNNGQTLRLRTISEDTSITLGSTRINLYGDVQIVEGDLEFTGTGTLNVTTDNSSTSLRLSTNQTSGGQILLNAGTNGNIQIVPTGTGRTLITACEPTLIDYAETIYSIGNSGSGTVTPDINNGNVQTVTATGNFTLALPSNIKTGSSLTLIITQDATGSRTCTFNASYKFAGGSKTLSTAANSIDVVSIFYDGSRYLASLGTNFS